MNGLPGDLLRVIALKLALNDLLNFSLSCNNVKKNTLDNQYFWSMKLEKRGIDSRVNDNKSLYKDMELSRRRCSYFYVRGINCGQRCPHVVLANGTKGSYRFCKECLKRMTVQRSL